MGISIDLMGQRNALKDSTEIDREYTSIFILRAERGESRVESDSAEAHS